MNFTYTYDSRGNITSETRNGLTTTYEYDALGQLVRVNDPHENATWVYEYDLGGNILRKRKYAYTTDVPGEALETIPYVYGDANWKDKLTSYNGATITYDAIGNPLDDGERTYTWCAGRQLQQIEMKSNNPIFTVDGTGSNGRNTLRIVHIERHKIAAEVLCGGSNITADTNPDHYTWYKRVGEDAEWVAAASGTKELSLVQSEMDAGFQYKCSYAGAVEEYGVLQVDNTTMASHTPGTADANDTFSLNGGVLSVTTDRTAGANYSLEDGNVKIESSNCETISATASFGARTTGKVISFKYNHNGLRTQKKVVENGVTTIYDYMLHGKLITHLTKRTVDENGEETNKDELHFFYDSNSKPAFVEYNGEKYRYIHNLQGDIVGIVDANGTLVVEYMEGFAYESDSLKE